MSKLTLQDVFDRVWDHFIAKKSPPSVSNVGTPRYRGPDGTKCAIGILIPDSVYAPDFEGSSVQFLLSAGGPYSRLARWVNDSIEGSVTKAGNFLARLQWAHDDATLSPDKFHYEMEAGLREVAQSFGLEVPQ